MFPIKTTSGFPTILPSLPTSPFIVVHRALAGRSLKHRLVFAWLFNRRSSLHQERLVELQHHAEISFRSGCCDTRWEDRSSQASIGQGRRIMAPMKRQLRDCGAMVDESVRFPTARAMSPTVSVALILGLVSSIMSLLLRVYSSMNRYQFEVKGDCCRRVRQ